MGFLDKMAMTAGKMAESAGKAAGKMAETAGKMTEQVSEKVSDAIAEKEFTCQRCGKTFVKRAILAGDICDECTAAIKEEQRFINEQIKGYESYRQAYGLKYISSDDAKEIYEKRTAILENCVKQANVLYDKEEYIKFGNEYQDLTAELAVDMYIDSLNTAQLIQDPTNFVHNKYFFALLKYEGVLVSNEDIIAVSYCTNYKSKPDNYQGEYVNFVFLTSDPHVPIFHMCTVIDTENGATMEERKIKYCKIYTDACPNIAYPAMELSDLKALILKEGTVRGNIDKNFALTQIGYALDSEGQYSLDELALDPSPDLIAFMEQYKIYFVSDIRDWLGKDRPGSKEFWDNVADTIYAIMDEDDEDDEDNEDSE